MNQPTVSVAPELETCHWINCEEALSIEQLRGKVIVLHAFQMLCPGCVVHGIPQASSIHALYPSEQVQVIGLHTVFEHHDVMTVAALEVFVKEYRLEFPIAVDTPSSSSAEPRTMQKYNLKGTPSLVLIDKAGHLRVNHFGRLSDMEVGNLIGQLLQEDCEAISEERPARQQTSLAASHDTSTECSDDACPTK
tara:strand:- start:2243 stop:2821 length:579 start_codon:yes stop_codon:yes gene_type:complete